MSCNLQEGSLNILNFTNILTSVKDDVEEVAFYINFFETQYQETYSLVKKTVLSNSIYSLKNNNLVIQS